MSLFTKVRDLFRSRRNGQAGQHELRGALVQYSQAKAARDQAVAETRRTMKETSFHLEDIGRALGGGGKR